MSKIVRAVRGARSEVFDLHSSANPKIGSGGQGDVYFKATKDRQCVKVMHDPHECKDQLAVVYRLLTVSPQLYWELREVATVPYWPIYEVGIGSDAIQPMVGYGMERLDGWTHLSTIMSPFGAREVGVGPKEIALIFIALHKALTRIHSQGFIVGDFNASNVMFRKSTGLYEVRVTDVDTWSIHRRELGYNFDSGVVDPQDACHREYQLAMRDGKRVAPKNYCDWWAFALHLYRALAKHDPFSEGIYLGYTRNERIIDNITTLSMGVELTKEVRLEIKRIGNGLLDSLDRQLRGQRTEPFPLELIAALYSGKST